MPDKLKHTKTFLSRLDMDSLSGFIHRYNGAIDEPDRVPAWSISVDGRKRRATDPQKAILLLAMKMGLPDVTGFGGIYEVCPQGEFLVSQRAWDKWKLSDKVAGGTGKTETGKEPEKMGKKKSEKKAESDESTGAIEETRTDMVKFTKIVDLIGPMDKKQQIRIMSTVMCYLDLDYTIRTEPELEEK